ncbi:ABC transporter permease subunit [Candidatus Acidulodesulfobacterium sp. H_13]|uniref:ABC transporter permease subunit n=1 Tax=Candidatus Acidulodesulfobacterium sp. H_13 TaxID=3395470 RepID=UPI003AF8C4A8
MKNILYTAIYSFNEIKNSKIFYSFLVFALVLIFGSYFVSQTSFISQGRIMVDFSIFAITIFNIFIGIFIGSSMVYDDIEKKSIFLSITRPVKRTEYLTGRFLGLTAAIILSTIIMMFIFYLVLLIMHKYVIPLPIRSVGKLGGQAPLHIKTYLTLYLLPQSLLIQALFIIIESVFIAVVALFFSLITSKALASIFTILVFFIGNISSRMNALVMPAKKIINGKEIIVHRVNYVLVAAVHLIYSVLPNFSIFNISSEVSYKISISSDAILYGIIYGLSYIILLFVISSLLFARRDIS